MANEVALYKIPEKIETARILDASRLTEYQDSVKSSFSSERAREVLNQFSASGEELTGSNPFMLVHYANSGFLPEGARLIERKDMETAVSLDNSFLSGRYTDLGLALRTAGDSYQDNSLLTKGLDKELRGRGIKLGKGKLIPLSGLELRESANSAYGLVFVLSDNLNKDNILDLNDFKWDYKREDGLARACRSYGGHWGSDNGLLASSDSVGRVVVVSGEASAQKILGSNLNELQKLRDSEIAKVQERYAKAERILRGE